MKSTITMYEMFWNTNLDKIFFIFSGESDAPVTVVPMFKHSGLKGYKKIVTDSISLADYTIEEFKKAGINAWRNKASMIVIFDKPSKKTIEKWQLSPKGNITHLITLTHLSKKMIKEIVSDVAKDLKRS